MDEPSPFATFPKTLTFGLLLSNINSLPSRQENTRTASNCHPSFEAPKPQNKPNQKIKMQQQPIKHKAATPNPTINLAAGKTTQKTWRIFCILYSYLTPFKTFWWPATHNAWHKRQWTVSQEKCRNRDWKSMPEPQSILLRSCDNTSSQRKQQNQR